MTKDPSLQRLIAYIAFGDGRASPIAWADTSLTVSLQGLADPEMRASARAALDIWTETTGITFTRVKTAADIRFDDRRGGAYADYSFSPGGELREAVVNVSGDWMDGFPSDQRWGVGDYGLQTFIHEIGHALGLNHAGPYNGRGTYASDAIFAKDTWKWSVMSYFDQESDGSQVGYFISSPGIADVAAIAKLYGRSDIRPGDDVYTMEELLDLKGRGTFVLVDSGGSDKLDFRGMTKGGASIDMQGGKFSTLGVDNPNDFAFALGTVIENAVGSDFTDSFSGNKADNRLDGGAYNDKLSGGAGDDTLIGGGGNFLPGWKIGDDLTGGTGADLFVFAKATHIDADRIFDFKTGVDRIDLANIDADLTTAGDQAFDFIKTARFGREAGQLRYQDGDGKTFLSGDVDGDGDAEFRLEFFTKVDLAARDFVL